MLGSLEIILIIFFILILFGSNQVLEFLKYLRIGMKQFKSTIYNIPSSDQEEA